MEQWPHFFCWLGACLADPPLPSESGCSDPRRLPACLRASWELRGWGVAKRQTHAALQSTAHAQLESGDLIASVSPLHPTSRGTLCCKLSHFLITADWGLGFLGSALSVNPLLSGFHTTVAVLS